MLRRVLIVSVGLAALWAAPAHASTFCGTAGTADRAPNVVAGNPVHAVYAIPSDGADNFAQRATQIQTDAEAIDAWWRGQDSTRTPRFDLFPFPCGSQLDLTSLRLQQSGAQLADPEAALQSIVNATRSSGLLTNFEKLLVYYEGPIRDPDACGIGDVNPQGAAVAVVLVSGCPGEETAPTAAHEMLHTLGAVPTGAPHDCTPPNDGHTCDNKLDIMYPFASGVPLTSLLLDPGRDDYYGHSGSFWDVQDSSWLVDLDAQTTLSLSISSGGSVTSDVPGLACSAPCATTWNRGTKLTLMPKPARGMRFLAWTGACSGSSNCSLQLAQNSATTALFGPATFRLNVLLTGRGAVRVGSAGTCSASCSKAVTSFVPQTLAARAAKGWRFKAWSGACKGTKATCSVPMSSAATARATFVRAKTER